MNRQQAAIKIAKVNRFIKQMNYWSELGENIHPAAFGDDIYSMSAWVKEIQAYLRTDKNFLLLADLIECVGDISVIDEYLGKRSRRMEEVMRQSLVGLSRNMKALLAECQELRKASKGCYFMLPDPLYNETAIGLLKRAVKADILNKEFAPSSKANYNNLKIVAYAVSQIMQFDRKHTYGYFGSPAKVCGLSIDSRKSKQEEFSVNDTSKLRPELFDFSIERFCRSIG